MLTVKHDTGNLVEITIMEKLRLEDFKDFEEKVDVLIKEHGNIRVLIDASGFDGWENLDAAEHHFSFVKGHHEKIKNLAVVAGHMWRH